MSNHIHHINDYIPSNSDNFFFDANVWLSIYGPIGYYDDWRVRNYSEFLRKLQMKNCNIYTNSIIVSEFVNRFSRLEFEQCRKQFDLEHDEFKKFRELEDFKQIASEIAINIRKIVRDSKICSCEMDDLTLFDLADNFENGNSDFNDLIFEEVCKANNLILVTHDGDFKDSKIEIVTANRYMLKN